MNSSQPGASRRMWLVLAVMLGAMWFWKAAMEGKAQPPVAYSQLYQWIKDAKVEGDEDVGGPVAGPAHSLGLSSSHNCSLQPGGSLEHDDPLPVTVRCARGGTVTRVRFPTSGSSSRRGGGLRRAIDGFSASSRRNMLVLLNSINAAVGSRSLFFTLTYGAGAAIALWRL